MKVKLGGGQRLNREETVLQRRQAREEIGDLIGSRKTQRGAAMRRQAGYVSAEERDPSFGRAGLSADQTEQRRLSGAVRADDGSALAGCHGKAHAVQRAKPVKRFGDIREVQR